MRFVVTALLVLCVGCGTYPKQKKLTYKQHSSHGHRTKTTTTDPGFVLVDAQWLDTYRKLQQEHGNYTISDDNKIRPVGSKFRVTKSQQQHFRDLSATPPSPPPKPTPNPEFNP